MRVAYLLLILLLPHISSAVKPSVIEIRDFYYKAPHCREAAIAFLHLMNNADAESSAILLGYKGVANMIMAHYYYNPYSKLACFMKGREMIEKSVRSDPENVEIRFLRFCVQSNAPYFLGYNHEIQQDKMVILKNWPKIQDQDLKQRIREYMLASNGCTSKEKMILT